MTWWNFFSRSEIDCTHAMLPWHEFTHANTCEHTQHTNTHALNLRLLPRSPTHAHRQSQRIQITQSYNRIWNCTKINQQKPKQNKKIKKIKSSNQKNIKSGVSALSSTSTSFGTAAASARFDAHPNGIDESVKALALAEEEAAMNQYKVSVEPFNLASSPSLQIKDSNF